LSVFSERIGLLYENDILDNENIAFDELRYVILVYCEFKIEK